MQNLYEMGAEEMLPRRKVYSTRWDLLWAALGSKDTEEAGHAVTETICWGYGSQLRTLSQLCSFTTSIHRTWKARFCADSEAFQSYLKQVQTRYSQNHRHLGELPFGTRSMVITLVAPYFSTRIQFETGNYRTHLWNPTIPQRSIFGNYGKDTQPWVQVLGWGCMFFLVHGIHSNLSKPGFAFYWSVFPTGSRCDVSQK